MTNYQIRRCREANIKRLAALMGGNEERATSLYNRCIRYALRYHRWGEAEHDSSIMEHPYRRKMHEHEGELVAALGKRLGDELAKLGLHWAYPGLDPIIEDELGRWAVELFWY